MAAPHRIARCGVAQLVRLHELHEQVMLLATTRLSSEAFGSALVAYVLSSFEQV